VEPQDPPHQEEKLETLVSTVPPETPVSVEPPEKPEDREPLEPPDTKEPPDVEEDVERLVLTVSPELQDFLEV